jgi:hypothetical protein
LVETLPPENKKVWLPPKFWVAHKLNSGTFPTKGFLVLMNCTYASAPN